MSEYISVNEARKILGIDEDAMLDLIVDNKIRNRKIDGENRVLAEDVEAYRRTLQGGDAGVETLELVDEAPAAAADAGRSATEVIPDRAGSSTTAAAPLRTEELFFEDDDLHEEASRTQDVTVVEQAVPVAAAVAVAATAPVAESVTEELSPEETPRDREARKRGNRPPSPIRRAAGAGVSARRGMSARRPGGKGEAAAKTGAGKGAAGWTLLLAATVLVAAWPLVMVVTQAHNGSYTNGVRPVSKDTAPVFDVAAGQWVQPGSDLMGMWKADWFKSIQEMVVGKDAPVLQWSNDRMSFNSGADELLGRPTLDVNAREESLQAKPTAPAPVAPVEGEGAAPADGNGNGDDAGTNAAPEAAGDGAAETAAPANVEAE